MDIISPILQTLNTHPHLSGFIVFLISAGESIAVFGTIVPGSLMMTAIGTLAGAGVIPLWSTIIWAILGAIVGDGISYWIGFYFKDRLREVWPFRTRKQLLANAEHFFRKYGGTSVFIGRFVGPVRALVPLVAGMFGMKPLKFTISNILSAIGWAPAYMFPGIMLGAASLELPPDIAVHAILVLLLISFFIIFCIWLVYRFFLLVRYNIYQMENWIWKKLEESRYFKLTTKLLKHHDSNQKHGQLTLAFYLILTLLLLFLLSAYVYTHGHNISLNNIVYHFCRSIRTPNVDTVMLWITNLGDKYVVTPVIFVLVVWFLLNRQWYVTAHILLLTILSAAAVVGLKHLVHFIRPWGLVHSPETFSYPSGHTTISTIFYMGFALLLVHLFKIKRYWPVLFTFIIIVLAVSLSRLYLGAHWLTDVLAGWLLGSALLMLVTLSFNRQRVIRTRTISVVILAFITFMSCYSLYTEITKEKLRHDYTMIAWPRFSSTVSQWWVHDNSELPLYRLNRFGVSDQVLRIQWLGNIDTIQNTLLQNGWTIPPEQDWINVLHRVTNVQSTEHLPLVSPIHYDKRPVVVLIKKFDNKKILALRIWDSNIDIQDSNDKLWVGTIENIPSTYSWLFKHKKNIPKISAELIFSNPPQSIVTKTINVKQLHNGEMQSQEILLIKSK